MARKTSSRTVFASTALAKPWERPNLDSETVTDEGKSERGTPAAFAMVIRSSGASLFFLSLCYFLLSSLHRSSFSPLSFSHPFHLVFSFTSRFILTCSSISYRFIQFTKITRVSWLNQSWMMTELLPSSDVRCVSFHVFRLAVLPNSSDVLVSRP